MNVKGLPEVPKTWSLAKARVKGKMAPWVAMSGRQSVYGFSSRGQANQGALELISQGSPAVTVGQPAGSGEQFEVARTDRYLRAMDDVTIHLDGVSGEINGASEKYVVSIRATRAAWFHHLAADRTDALRVAAEGMAVNNPSIQITAKTFARNLTAPGTPWGMAETDSFFTDLQGVRVHIDCVTGTVNGSAEAVVLEFVDNETGLTRRLFRPDRDRAAETGREVLRSGVGRNVLTLEFTAAGATWEGVHSVRSQVHPAWAPQVVRGSGGLGQS